MGQSGGTSADGTYFFGGAGIDGDYISDITTALSEAGISDVHNIDRELWSGGTAADAAIGVFVLRNEIDLGDKINLNEKFVSQGDGKGQFNLIGYSYGSLVAAQVAMTHVQKGGSVDNLVLIGSPISAKFLQILRTTNGIGNVHVRDLTEHGDPIYAGMGAGRLLLNTPKLSQQMRNGTGHFYYAPSTEAGMRRRRELSKDLYDAGLR